MINPSLAVPDALSPLLELTKVIGKTGVPKETLDLVRLRVSQINGRVYLFPTDFGKADDGDERLFMVDEWQRARCFSAAERAALGLAEVVTKLSDRDDPVPDAVWDEATSHYNDQQMGALVLQIGLVNLWNRVNLSSKEEPGEWR